MRKTNKIVIVVLILLVGTLMASCQKTEKPDPNVVSKYSDPEFQKMMTAVNAGNYGKFSEDFDGPMKQAMNEDKFKDFASKVKTNLGEYQSSIFTGTDKAQQYTRAFYNVTFSLEKNPVQFTVVFSEQDGKMLVSGLFSASPKLK